MNLDVAPRFAWIEEWCLIDLIMSVIIIESSMLKGNDMLTDIGSSSMRGWLVSRGFCAE